MITHDTLFILAKAFRGEPASQLLDRIRNTSDNLEAETKSNKTTCKAYTEALQWTT